MKIKTIPSALFLGLAAFTTQAVFDVTVEVLFFPGPGCTGTNVKDEIDPFVCGDGLRTINGLWQSAVLQGKSDQGAGRRL